MVEWLRRDVKQDPSLLPAPWMAERMTEWVKFAEMRRRGVA